MGSLDSLSHSLTRTLLTAPIGLERLRTRLLLWTFWFVLGAMETAKELTAARLQQIDRPLTDALLVNFPWWFFWAFGTLIVVSLAQRWPIDRGNPLPAVARHTFAALLIVTLHLTFVAVIIWLAVARGSAMAGSVLPVQIRFWIEGYIVLDFFVYWMVLGAYHALIYHQRYMHGALREAEMRTQAMQHEAAAVAARLNALQMELNPHFLFNSLNAVSALVDEGRTTEATTVISQLAQLLRLTLHRGHERELDLDAELEYVQLYLAMEQVRFGDRLQVDIDAAEGLAGALVPPMILQPLVENAVRHGVSRRPGAAHIRITVRRSGAALLLAVHDDGPGMSSGAVRNGTGLSNVRERLSALYGDDARLATGPAPAGGFLAEIQLPLRTRTQQRALAIA